jgi:hypothetical protein
LRDHARRDLATGATTNAELWPMSAIALRHVVELEIVEIMLAA